METLSPLKRALFELREMRAQLDSYERELREPIAVIGVGCRFPGNANGPEAYWRLLRDGVDAIREIPPDRWDADAYYDPDPETPGKLATRWGGFINGVDQFDADFFGVTPREATSMDPQQRLLLEVCWEALGHAGQSPQKLAGSPTGVFVGIGTNDYTYLRLKYTDPTAIDAYLAMGTSHSVASGRLSYTLGLEGPSISVDTACSSSLMAAHLAAQSLRRGECDLALVGGVNLILMPEMTMTLSKARMMAGDGRCKTFDARADGFVRAEGVGIVVLKRLSEAIADRDHVLAVIRGSAANQDGRSNGLTAPNGLSQEAVIRAALTNAGMEPAQVDYVETHGTGTSLGDPIEVQALAAVYGPGRPAGQPLALGSVKTNFGHMEAGAGVAGLIKAVLSLHHSAIPPHLHLTERNPLIPWESLPPFDIHTRLTPWPQRSHPRAAGVSSFGFSGTNVHIILEEAPADPAAPEDTPDRPLHLLLLSARGDEALRQLAAAYEKRLAAEDAESTFADICFTAAVGRAHLSHRLALTAATATEARQQLAAFGTGQTAEGMSAGQVVEANAPEVAFLFTGHGAQHRDMGRRLYETAPVFRAALDECAELLRPYLPLPLLSVMFSDAAASPEANSIDLDTSMTYGQPALFALEYALAALWRSWGVEPTMVMGHSVGEYVAACVAGVLSLADGLKLVAARGRLMDSLTQPGEMVAVFADEAYVAQAIAGHADRVSIAAINGPTNVVISGDRAAVRSILVELEAAEIKYRPLAVGVAAHSPLLDPILDAFARTAAEIEYAAPRIALVSGLTGRPVDRVDAGYWRRHLRQPVRFAGAIQTLHDHGHRHFLEIGPQPVLCGMGQRCLPDATHVWLPSLRRDWEDWQQMLESAAALHTQGVAIDWEGFEKPYWSARRRRPLPAYPWQHESYWVDEIRPARSGRPALPVAGPGVSGQLIWEQIAAAGEYQAGQGPLGLRLDNYTRREEALGRLSTAYIVATLRELGVFTRPGETHTAESLLEQGQIASTHHGLLARWLKKLAAEGLLEAREEGAFTNPAPLPEISPEPFRQEAHSLSPDGPELPDYVARCGEKLAAVLSGQESPLELLFPGGSYETADYLYHSSPPPAYCNGIAREVTEALARSLPPSQKVRVLEVGAGTGGTTAALLPVLPPDRTDYTFTDMSEFFFARAEQRFAAYPFVRYGLLNLEEAPEAQGYARHSYDLVVGANVFHATQDLDRALQHAWSLLAPGGVLLLYETTHHPSWFEVSIGLIEGWSRFQDAWREGNPLLASARWREALLANGFERVASWPEAGSAAETLSVHILVAQAPDAGQTAGSPAGKAPARPESAAAPAAIEAAPASSFLADLREALPDDQLDLLVDYVRQRVIKVTRSRASRVIGSRDRLMDLGVDSLMAVELRTLLSADLALAQPLPATLIFDYPSIEDIARYLQKMWLFDEPSAVVARPAAAPQTNVAAIEALSDEEIEALLLQKLGDM